MIAKIKIGKGYWQSGYGRGFKKSPIVWNINGKAYVKDSNSEPYQTDLPGFIMVNKSTEGYFAVGLISEHKQL